MYNLHIEELFKKNLFSSTTYSIVSCAVYFHCENHGDIMEFLENSKADDTRFIQILGKDSLNNENFLPVLNKTYMNKQSRIFDSELYKSFKRHLQPSMHELENGVEVSFGKKQKQLIVSKQAEQKIKGVAGSGKTLI